MPRCEAPRRVRSIAVRRAGRRRPLVRKPHRRRYRHAGRRTGGCRFGSRAGGAPSAWNKCMRSLSLPRYWVRAMISLPGVASPSGKFTPPNRSPVARFAARRGSCVAAPIIGTPARMPSQRQTSKGTVVAAAASFRPQRFRERDWRHDNDATVGQADRRRSFAGHDLTPIGRRTQRRADSSPPRAPPTPSSELTAERSATSTRNAAHTWTGACAAVPPGLSGDQRAKRIAAVAPDQQRCEYSPFGRVVARQLHDADGQLPKVVRQLPLQKGLCVGSGQGQQPEFRGCAEHRRIGSQPGGGARTFGERGGHKRRWGGGRRTPPGRQRARGSGGGSIIRRIISYLVDSSSKKTSRR